MSSSDFEMPKVIGNGAQQQGLQGVTRAVEEALASRPYGAPNTNASNTYSPPKTPTHSSAIKDRLKQLTHREMRDFVGEIFDAHRKLRTERAHPMQNASAVDNEVGGITMAQLPDVLDKLAYGD